MSKNQFDFSGWATKNNLKCSDGRTIRKDAFKDDDGKIVPLVWMHQHNDPANIIGHALLENRAEGTYSYCSFNDSHTANEAKELVNHGDVTSLSIWANNLTQNNGDVLHGSIKEVSLVLAGANPGAVIDFPILAHGEESDSEAYISVDEPLLVPKDEESLFHAEDEKKEEDDKDSDGRRPIGDIIDEMTDEEKDLMKYLMEAAVENDPDDDEDIGARKFGSKTGDEIYKAMSKEKREVVAYMIGAAIEEAKNGGNDEDDEDDDGDDENDKKEIKHSEGMDTEMKKNVFDVYGEGNDSNDRAVLSHADGMDMIKYAKDNHVSLKQVLTGWAEENNLDYDTLSHDDLGINNISQLFPDYKLINGPSPELMTTDQGWITKVINKTHKSPMSRLRVRFADVRDISARRAKGYTKQTQKDFAGNIDLLGRTSDPTTVYISSKLDRDDIVDITDFDVVNYMYNLDRMNLNEELARQIMIGDGRNGAAEKAIDPTKIIPIWTDDDLFCIHRVVDIAGMRETMNGGRSESNFGDNYVYAEAIIQSLLYAREQYKGSGNPDFFCTPHLVNVMLLARDLNGRRIYDNVNDLKAALNVNEIITAEQFEGKTRTATIETTAGGTTTTTTEVRDLLGIMVNLSDYTIGATKGGEITHFTDFDIRFNQELSLLETRCSGMLTRPYSAIALETVHAA